MPTTIELAYAGTENGLPVYAPPMEALTKHIVNGITWLLLNYPSETAHVTLNILALASVTGACMWLASDAERPKEGKKHS
jgi:hypothetical protein